ncbi:MAG TPA: hypothetical protein VG223_11960 [Solirubrobacteraceae bacterium]|jgi:hypothetical protein|nr:hypothetical protein [Solirubrobacteraceae bacterium]
MAQAKRKRKSKHRGNAAGLVEARGRTTRPLPEKARKAKAKAVSREERMSRPPSWSRSAKTAMAAGAFMFLFLAVTNSKQIGNDLVLAIVALLLYIPAGYQMEKYMWKRRMAKKTAGR